MSRTRGQPDRGARRRPSAPSSTGSARDLACQVLARVERDRAFAGRALSAALDRAAHLGASDRALATEIVYGVLRRMPRLDRALAALASKSLGDLAPEARIALRVAAYQILFLDRVPVYAAVDDAVERCKRVAGRGVAGFANAVLRRLARTGEPPLPVADEDPVGWMVESACLPEWIARLLVAERGPVQALAFAGAMQTPAPLGLRVNATRADVDGARARLLAERPAARIERSPIAPAALVARGLDALAETAVFREGWAAVEDVGAQVVVELAGAVPGDRILDACAGVGGKTAHLLALAGGRAEVEAADVSEKKLREARENLVRLGAGSARTLVRDLTAPPPAGERPYDRILLDAPCSGLGVLRRHPEALARRSPADLPALAERQRRLVGALAPLVRPGGLLVYSVCTFERAECEDIVEPFLGAHGDFRIEPPAEPHLRPLADARGFVRTWPHRHDADAFFAARLRRAG